MPFFNSTCANAMPTNWPGVMPILDKMRSAFATRHLSMRARNITVVLLMAQLCYICAELSSRCEEVINLTENWRLRPGYAKSIRR